VCRGQKKETLGSSQRCNAKLDIWEKAGKTSRKRWKLIEEKFDFGKRLYRERSELYERWTGMIDSNNTYLCSRWQRILLRAGFVRNLLLIAGKKSADFCSLDQKFVWVLCSGDKKDLKSNTSKNCKKIYWPIAEFHGCMLLIMVFLQLILQ